MRQSTETKRGRAAPYIQEHHLWVNFTCCDLLSRRETRISVRNFVGQYLSIFEIPLDMCEA